MKFLNVARRYAAKAALFAAPLALATQAHAALPEGVKTAISTAQADGVEVGWLIIGVLAALFVFALMRRQIK
ncbi:major capsid protein [Neisseria sp. S1]|uniref:major capsid protein n=1 Tax=Neisseria sp. S1 TaxID=3318354 RepID=UPI003A848017